jgi:hypothetical protein
MPHVHESTRPILVGSMIAFKKAFQRFVIAMITDSTYVLGASVLLSASEIGYAVSVKVRDRFMYNKLCSACSAPGEDRLAAMKLNKFLRSRNAHYEAVMEVRSQTPYAHDHALPSVSFSPSPRLCSSLHMPDPPMPSHSERSTPRSTPSPS